MFYLYKWWLVSKVWSVDLLTHWGGSFFQILDSNFFRRVGRSRGGGGQEETEEANQEESHYILAVCYILAVYGWKMWRKMIHKLRLEMAQQNPITHSIYSSLSISYFLSSTTSITPTAPCPTNTHMHFQEDLTLLWQQKQRPSMETPRTSWILPTNALSLAALYTTGREEPPPSLG